MTIFHILQLVKNRSDRIESGDRQQLNLVDFGDFVDADVLASGRIDRLQQLEHRRHVHQRYLYLMNDSQNRTVRFEIVLYVIAFSNAYICLANLCAILQWMQWIASQLVASYCIYYTDYVLSFYLLLLLPCSTSTSVVSNRNMPPL